MKSGLPGEKTRQAFVDYIRILASVLHAHHLAEDELEFPIPAAWKEKRRPMSPFLLV